MSPTTPRREVGRAWRIAVVEDHLLQGRRTEELLDRQRGLRVVHSSETLAEFVAWIGGLPVERYPTSWCST